MLTICEIVRCTGNLLFSLHSSTAHRIAALPLDPTLCYQLRLLGIQSYLVRRACTSIGTLPMLNPCYRLRENTRRSYRVGALTTMRSDACTTRNVVRTSGDLMCGSALLMGSGIGVSLGGVVLPCTFVSFLSSFS